MERTGASGLSILVALWAVSAPVAAVDRWSYEYQGVQVTAEGSSRYTVHLAHNLRRLDATLIDLIPFGLRDRQPLTRIYAVSPQLRKQLDDKETTLSSFWRTNAQNYLLIYNVGQDSERYRGAYTGYVRGRLSSQGDPGYPDWYSSGMGDLLGTAMLDGDQVSIGAFIADHAYTLYREGRMPVRAVLGLHWDDPLLKSEQARRIYEAESWFLVRQIVIEGEHRAEFASYLSLLHKGQSAGDAFAASFKVSYEDLDRMMLEALRARRYHELSIKVPDPSGPEKPQTISAEEMERRLTDLMAARRGTSDQAKAPGLASARSDTSRAARGTAP
ncbi:MAG TPA: hypothetical protein VFB37_08915 [Steroidobacteraceae bacterium]|nr:hypothetical protein [Steroidobacteraceae bacterium]